ncbi:hypothetical protein HYT01_03765 [Candidatus Giovannonibacteria bacterium]|nr:hypothetical protein [Candidatus Giovannonibacteria bacterium]
MGATGGVAGGWAGMAVGEGTAVAVGSGGVRGKGPSVHPTRTTASNAVKAISRRISPSL